MELSDRVLVRKATVTADYSSEGRLTFLMAEVETRDEGPSFDAEVQGIPFVFWRAEVGWVGDCRYRGFPKGGSVPPRTVAETLAELESRARLGLDQDS